MTNQPEKPNKNQWVEELELASNQLVDKMKDLLQEGNVRHVIIRNPDGKSLLEVPLTTGVAVGGVAMVVAPQLAILAAIGALAAYVNNVRIEVIRTGPAPDTIKILDGKSTTSKKSKVTVLVEEDDSQSPSENGKA